jgi:hypothetical protein
MLTIIVNRKPKTSQWSLLAALVHDAKLIRNLEFPNLKHSFVAYEDAYYWMIGNSDINWLRKYPQALEKLEEDLETVKNYEHCLRRIPVHVRQLEIVH